MAREHLDIALLSYRGHPEVGGQGIYVRSLSGALMNLGHRVTVFSGPPFPHVPDGVRLVEVPSLDLYRPQDPFRRPARSEFRGPTDVLEYLSMCRGSFPEPLTFSLRVARLLRDAAFDVVHDNQSLGYGLLPIRRRIPLVATIHHPISVDRRLALDRAEDDAERRRLERWYRFIRMQERVARRIDRIITVSGASARDVVQDLGVPYRRIHVVPNGVDTGTFRPLDLDRIPGRILTVASSDLPGKGLDVLAEAVAKLATERNIELHVIGEGGHGDHFSRDLERLGISGRVHRHGRVDAVRMVEEIARAQVVVVPSLYEGFSLPAVEAMACGAPLVTTDGGAIGEVVGDAAEVVPAGDPSALAAGIARMMDAPAYAERLARRARARVLERFTWSSAAERLVTQYEEVIACRR